MKKGLFFFSHTSVSGKRVVYCLRRCDLGATNANDTHALTRRRRRRHVSSLFLSAAYHRADLSPPHPGGRSCSLSIPTDGRRHHRRHHCHQALSKRVLRCPATVIPRAIVSIRSRTSAARVVRCRSPIGYNTLL